MQRTSRNIQGSNEELIGVPKTEKEEEVFKVALASPKLKRQMSSHGKGVKMIRILIGTYTKLIQKFFFPEISTQDYLRVSVKKKKNRGDFSLTTNST